MKMKEVIKIKVKENSDIVLDENGLFVDGVGVRFERVKKIYIYKPKELFSSMDYIVLVILFLSVMITVYSIPFVALYLYYMLFLSGKYYIRFEVEEGYIDFEFVNKEKFKEIYNSLPKDKMAGLMAELKGVLQKI